MLMLCCAVFLLAACGGKPEAKGDGADERILFIGNSREPNTLDPHISGSWAALRIKDGIFEGLLTVDGKSLEPIPGVAERWDVSEDKTRYHFYLRPDASWSDGIPVTANDFKESFRRALSPELGSDMPKLFLYNIVGAEDFHEGRLSDFKKVGIEVLSDRELQIDIRNPDPYFLHALTYFFPVPIHRVEQLGTLTDRSNAWSRELPLVSNGPFLLQSWTSHDRIILRKNFQYWDKDRVRIREIHLLPIDSVVTEELAFRRGELDVTTKVPPSRIKHYQQEQSKLLHMDPLLGVFFLQLNLEVDALKSRTVRQALHYSLNKELLLKGVLKDGKEAADFLVPPPLLPMPASVEPAAFQPERARQLLRDAGYPEGRGFPPIKLYYNTSETYRQLMEAIQSMWRKELGIEVELVNQEWSVFVNSMDAGNFDIGRYGFIPPYPDPKAMFRIMTSDGYGNFTHWGSREYDAILAQVEAGGSEALLERCNAILFEESPIIPIFYYNAVYLKNEDLQGWHSNLMDRHPFKALFWEKNAENEAK